MAQSSISLPYPVLGINDDVYPLLAEDCVVCPQPVKTASDYIFSIRLKQSNQKIAQLISEGKAEYACEIECKDTYLRICETNREPLFKITLSRKNVNGRINFRCFVAAKQDIKGYTNPDFNPDYEGFSFDLEAGDYLVAFPLAYYNTEIKYDKLYAAGSFMQIVDGGKNCQKTSFNLESNRIEIEMPSAMFQQYLRFSGNEAMEIIHSSLVYNALMFAIYNIDDYIEKGKTWADAIVQRMQTEKELKQYSLDDKSHVADIASILLGDPYKRLFDRMSSDNDTED